MNNSKKREPTWKLYKCRINTSCDILTKSDNVETFIGRKTL